MTNSGFNANDWSQFGNVLSNAAAIVSGKVMHVNFGARVCVYLRSVLQQAEAAPAASQQARPPLAHTQYPQQPQQSAGGGYPQQPRQQQPMGQSVAQQPLGQSMQGGGGAHDPNVLPANDDDCNLEELCSHDNPRNLYSDWKKVGEGYVSYQNLYICVCVCVRARLSDVPMYVCA